MVNPEMLHVNSSNVQALGYDAETQTVHVIFHDNSHYIYKGVSQFEYEGLLNAPSIGSYLHRNFKNVYPYERIAC
jgi:hypothetical protein